MNAVTITGGRVKACGWQVFTRPARWEGRAWHPTRHLSQRCAERRIPLRAIEAGLALADLHIPLDDGLLKLGLSRRALRRAIRAPDGNRQIRFLKKLVVVVSAEGDIITAWLERPRQPNQRTDEAVADRVWRS